MSVMHSTVRALGPQDGVDNQQGDERCFDGDVRPHLRLELSMGHELKVPQMNTP
jgi:hypothetical protein